ncbi:CTP:molybdopterin cytidylyltransferase MocA [Lutibacter agarilyticus]|uniref:CTP:molybdopterin cytidylyltransferase MocA n=1 Tax=Lutibacter agarilyticus TaxID=1109740 RepID=A0A238XXG3_9FLAO|nr:NTP transferase domain-containing protein [Lutibacter agarilyticus]SNR63380.1 CTP:molybdopterin cytidylyltransferase MocA [Lutibacter agarilyticus]
MKNNTIFVLLAGGKSERMGFPKGLLRYQKTYWILEQLNRISKTTIEKVYIGLGHDFEQYFEAIPWFEKTINSAQEFKGLSVTIIINKTPELGSFSTLQTVLKEINTSKNILLNPIDIPLLNSNELEQLISTNNEIAFPNFEGKNGHPIKMAYSFWNNLTTLDLNDKDARLDFQLKEANPAKISIIEVSDRVILYNLNTKSAWESFLKLTIDN